MMGRTTTSDAILMVLFAALFVMDQGNVICVPAGVNVAIIAITLQAMKLWIARIVGVLVVVKLVMVKAPFDVVKG